MIELTPFNKRRWITQANEIAEEILAAPPHRHSHRVEPKGELCRKLFFPLSLCPRTNEMIRQHIGKQVRLKAEILDLVRYQVGRRKLPSPLPGRPQLLCTRFSPRAPDRNSDWSKYPVDSLIVPKRWKTKNGFAERKGVGLIVDDGASHVEYECWWEPGPGFVMIRVFSGET